jgi:transcriptional regulator with XRE-family HTH domain
VLNWPLSDSLRARGVRQEDLAVCIGSSRSHVCQVLNGVPGRGHQTRKKLAPLLTPDERELLGWTPDGELVPVESSKHSKTPLS